MFETRTRELGVVSATVVLLIRRHRLTLCSCRPICGLLSVLVQVFAVCAGHPRLDGLDPTSHWVAA